MNDDMLSLSPSFTFRVGFVLNSALEMATRKGRMGWGGSGGRPEPVRARGRGGHLGSMSAAATTDWGVRQRVRRGRKPPGMEPKRSGGVGGVRRDEGLGGSVMEGLKR